MLAKLKGVVFTVWPYLLAVAAMAGFLAFLASMTATFLGGFTRIYRTPPDDVLYVLYLSPLLILVPWVGYVLSRRWQKARDLDQTQKWTRVFKCVTLVIAGGGLAMILKCLLRLGPRKFDHELPAAGILFLFGAFCCLECLRDYKTEPRWSWTWSTSRTRLLYLGISLTMVSITVGFVGYLLAIGKIR